MKNRSIFIASILGLVLGLSLAFNVIQRVDTKKLRESKESLKNDLYELAIQKDSLRVAKDSIQQILNEYMYLVDSLDVLVESNKSQIRRLNYSLSKALDKIDQMSGDEIYEGVIGELDISSTMVSTAETYSFTGDQTKEIYKDAIRINYLDSMVIEQRKMVQRMSNQLLLKDQIVSTLKDDNQAKENLIQKLYNDISNATIQLDMSEADNRRLKKTLRMWQTGSIGSAGALVLILLLL